MDTKTKTYVIIGVVALVVILLIVAIIVHFNGGDPTIPATTATAAAVALAASAAAKREEATQIVSETRKEGAEIAASVEVQDKATTEKMTAVETEVRNATAEDKIKEAEKLFGK